MTNEARRPVDGGAASRLAAVRERIRIAAEASGRDPRAVCLVAVSKTIPADRVVELAGLGQVQFGENRVQEAAEKVPRVRETWDGAPLVWRMVGHLQSNKVRPALECFDRFDSVDTLRLARRLDAAAREANRVLPVLLQVNVSGEPQKSGFAPDDLFHAAADVAGLDGIEVQGLMTVARHAERAETARGDFRALRTLRDDLVRRWGRPLPELSMGMSHDLEVAVAEGATLVRVGTALFGPRR